MKWVPWGGNAAQYEVPTPWNPSVSIACYGSRWVPTDWNQLFCQAQIDFVGFRAFLKSCILDRVVADAVKAEKARQEEVEKARQEAERVAAAAFSGMAVMDIVMRTAA